MSRPTFGNQLHGQKDHSAEHRHTEDESGSRQTLYQQPNQHICHDVHDCWEEAVEVHVSMEVTGVEGEAMIGHADGHPAETQKQELRKTWSSSICNLEMLHNTNIFPQKILNKKRFTKGKTQWLSHSLNLRCAPSPHKCISFYLLSFAFMRRSENRFIYFVLMSALSLNAVRA